uniref:Putative CDGSH iron-sulfur domain-containing protein NEET n=1 Tax=Davidia involucrata TaxID=16924 RepID=A0A5B6YLN2_DAVIN
MASVVSMVSTGFTHSISSPEGMNQTRGGRIGTHLTCSSSVAVRPRRVVVVRAEAINTEIRKTEEKVVDSVIVSELSKPLTAYCRCWRSGTFPLCDGSHVKHNKATGDNVGPLLLKKQ